jgi:hypothetical protein
MNALVPPPPASPNVGDMWQNWVWNGTQWICTPQSQLRVSAQVFAPIGTHTYMPSIGLVTAVVELWGAGGGGGGALSGASLQAIGGGGGGSGGYTRKTVPAALIAGGAVIITGAGGAGGLSVVAATGGVGGQSSFGGLAFANGGNGGHTGTSNPNASGYGGKGGDEGMGEINFPGNAGGVGGYTSTATAEVLGGLGGVPPLGGGVRPVEAAFAGTGVQFNGPDADGPSAGGGGAVSAISGNANAVGGVGGAGLCIVTEYCFGNVTGACPPQPIHPPGCRCGCGGRARVGLWSDDG